MSMRIGSRMLTGTAPCLVLNGHIIELSLKKMAAESAWLPVVGIHRAIYKNKWRLLSMHLINAVILSFIYRIVPIDVEASYTIKRYRYSVLLTQF